MIQAHKRLGVEGPQPRFLSANPVSEVPKSVQIVKPGPAEPIHYLASVLHADYLLSISPLLRGLKGISKSPASELRVSSTTHSHTAGWLGINWRGNVVNSRVLSLCLTAGGRGYCYMKASLSVSIIISLAATFQRMNWPHLVTLLE